MYVYIYIRAHGDNLAAFVARRLHGGLRCVIVLRRRMCEHGRCAGAKKKTEIE
jgi:hypothetical protein